MLHKILLENMNRRDYLGNQTVEVAIMPKLVINSVRGRELDSTGTV
jgi:hypothetical protein